MIGRSYIHIEEEKRKGGFVRGPVGELAWQKSACQACAQVIQTLARACVHNTQLVRVPWALAQRLRARALACQDVFCGPRRRLAVSLTS